MHAKQVCHKIINNALDWMHTLRRASLNACVLAAINERRLSVTGLGRAIESDAKEKHCIKRADRLLSNTYLHHEHRDIYHAVSKIIIGATRRPVILVDWSDLDDRKQHFLLRAAVALEGRSLTIYEEVHTIKTKEKPEVHRVFLKRIKEMLNEKCTPIIVTDSGFRTPWFKEVEKLGWDWVGRIRHRHYYSTDKESEWIAAKSLYCQASSLAKYIGQVYLTKRDPITCGLVLCKGKAKGRIKKTRQGERACSAHSKKNARRESEPWLLATSLRVTSKLAKQVVRIYATRMQIEEAFRDTKSLRYGIGFELNLTQNQKRLQVLLLIAMLAAFVLWLLGTIAKTSDQHRHYQANSVKNRNVLSVIYLGLRIANDKRFNMNNRDIVSASNILWKSVVNYDNSW